MNLRTDIMEADTAMRHTWREKEVDGPTLNLPEVIVLVREGAFPGGIAVRTASGATVRPPAGRKKNPYCPMATAPTAPKERPYNDDWGDNEWGRKSRKQKYDKEWANGNILMKNDYWRRRIPERVSPTRWRLSLYEWQG